LFAFVLSTVTRKLSVLCVFVRRFTSQIVTNSLIKDFLIDSDIKTLRKEK
jgi:hypothetical protein